MDENEIRAWLNPKNQQLLSEIESKIPVKFTLWEKDYFGCQVHKNEQGEHCEVEIYVKKNLSQAKIAHELLHAKVDLVLGDGYELFNVENKTKALEDLLSGDGAGNIVNACEHLIFYHDFIDMGFSENDMFENDCLSDEARKMLDNLHEHGLKLGLNYDINRVFQYLSLAFSLCFYPNEKKFEEEIKILKDINSVLFSKVNTLKKTCVDLEITPENKVVLADAYNQFSKGMNSWFNANRPKKRKSTNKIYK